jgi:hypothetical protein
MADTDRLIPRISSVLLSLAAMKIDFWAHRMHVSGGGYVMVWFFISQGLIKLRVARAGQIPKGAEAMYDYGSHTLWFPRDSYGIRREERAFILHECTHALRDIMANSAFIKEGLYGSNITGQLHFDNEAAAYIAGSLFYIYDNGVEWPVGPGQGEEIYSAANSIANGIKNKQGARVDEANFFGLRAKVSLDPTNVGANIVDPNEPDRAKGWRNWIQPEKRALEGSKRSVRCAHEITGANHRMATFHRAVTPGATYFFTVNTYQRQALLTDPPVYSALREALRAVKRAHPFTIDALILLPDHLHCLWTLPEGDATMLALEPGG